VVAWKPHFQWAAYNTRPSIHMPYATQPTGWQHANWAGAHLLLPRQVQALTCSLGPPAPAAAKHPIDGHMAVMSSFVQGPGPRPHNTGLVALRESCKLLRGSQSQAVKPSPALRTLHTIRHTCILVSHIAISGMITPSRACMQHI
jgi:hypothetical protein